jgi:hypothetical protein
MRFVMGILFTAGVAVIAVKVLNSSVAGRAFLKTDGIA